MSDSIVLVGGRPGSGKSTLAENVTKYDSNYYHLSIGNHLRNIGNGVIQSAYSSNVRAQKDTLSRSERLDDEVVNNIVIEAVASKQLSSVTLLDGYPRFPGQIQRFRDSLQRSNISLLALLHINVDRDVALERIIKRGTRPGEINVDLDFASFRIEQHDSTYVSVVEQISKIVPVFNVDTTQDMHSMTNTSLDILSKLS